MLAAGVISEDTTLPEQAVIDPQTGKVTETIGGNEGWPVESEQPARSDRERHPG